MDTQQLWLEEANGVITLGMSEALQEEAGDIAYVSLTKAATVDVDDTILNLEASKAAIEVPTPVAGQVIAVNEAAMNQPELLNSTDRADNWVIRLKAN
ncbi:glycine cleavage system protein H [Suicoccus acidiformans]|uniref:Glycine cleavage system protein H n=1 Tax=Suicoccus acidiformans TaxID=2036206 RepID=A0A347WKN2_9LACT|nr:biotin/lipoyl-containing protein [Suicoccus acidiformans]AXY25639.1 glycine cleavage system protein H [Suicoccus acidiformans]